MASSAHRGGVDGHASPWGPYELLDRVADDVDDDVGPRHILSRRETLYVIV